MANHVICKSDSADRQCWGLGGMPKDGRWQVFDASAAGARPVNQWFTSDVTSGSGANGYRMHRRASDLAPLTVAWWEDSAPKWEMGLDGATNNLTVYSHALAQNVFHMRADTGQVEFGPGAVHPVSAGQFQVYGGTAASPRNALRATVYGNAYSGLVLNQGNAGTKRSMISYNGGAWILGTDVAGSNSDSYHIWNSSGGTLVTITNAGKFILAGSLGVGNRVARTTLAAPGTVTGAVELFDAGGNSIGSVPVYANGSLT